MVERTEIEKYVRNMVALDILSKPLSSLGGKAERRRDKNAKDISSLIKEKEYGERIFARIEKRDEKKARTLREGINEFTEQYPNYGKILEGIIEEERTKSNKYLAYGIEEGYSLGNEDYIRVMIDLGFKREAACAMYPHLKEVSTQMKKANEQEERLILL